MRRLWILEVVSVKVHILYELAYELLPTSHHRRRADPPSLHR